MLACLMLSGAPDGGRVSGSTLSLTTVFLKNYLKGRISGSEPVAREDCQSGGEIAARGSTRLAPAS